MGDAVNELLVTDVAAAKLGARDISDAEIEQLPRNSNVTVRNPSGDAERHLPIGRPDGGRALTLVIERTIEPTSWLVVTGWTATEGERRILGDRAMTKDPWTDADPRPGDFDAFLESIHPGEESVVERHAGSADAKLTRVVRVSGEDAARLDAPAAARGQQRAEVVAELVRNA